MEKHELVGVEVRDLDTPALLLDGEKCRRNLARLAEFFRERSCKLRPHFKNHKCVSLARGQLEAGAAVGMTCAKVGEAEVLVEHGFTDVLIANQVVGVRKTERVAALARRANVAVAVDHVSQVSALSAAAARAGSSLGVLVEVDIGMGRCGVPAGDPALELARAVLRSPALRFEGLQAFEGHLVYVNDYEERAVRTRAAMALAIASRRLIERAGIAVPRISGGSTATYTITGTLEGIDELQAGTYATMDWRYGEVVPELEIALEVLTRVISSREGAVVLDVGVKGAGGEFGVPRLQGLPDVEVPFFLAEEHLVVRNAPALPVGEPLRLVSSHACTTCNLHRELIVHEGGVVVDVWPIEASGRLT